MAKSECLRFSRKREDAYNYYLEIVEGMRESERKRGRRTWAIYDSPLNPLEDRNFSNDFRHVIPEGHSLESFVLREFANKKGALVGLEFGGPGSRCFAGFPKGYFRLTAGVTLVDLRDDDEKAHDSERQHHVVEFDVTDPLLPKKLREELSMNKAHFILERMDGGLPHIPDPYFLYRVGNDWYQLLENPGVMFVQCPPFTRRILPQWVQKVNATTNGSVKACYYSGDEHRTVLRISKKDGAPESLPFLTPRELKTAFT